MKFGLGSLLSEFWAVSFILFTWVMSGRVRGWCWVTFGAGRSAPFDNGRTTLGPLCSQLVRRGGGGGVTIFLSTIMISLLFSLSLPTEMQSQRAVKTKSTSTALI